MTRFRRWLHMRGEHRFCRTVERRVRVGTDFNPEFLVGTDPRTGEAIKIDTTVFGGRAIYKTVKGHG